jgi:hypothetical protein
VPAQRGDPLEWADEGHLRDCDHGDRIADHVEELDRVSLVGYSGHSVPFHGGTDIARAQATFGDIAGQNHVAVQRECHVAYPRRDK